MSYYVRQVARVLIWTVLIFIFLRGLISFAVPPKKMMNTPVQKVTYPQQTESGPEVTGALFIQKWFQYLPNENVSDRNSSLEPFVTPSFYSNLAENEGVKTSGKLSVSSAVPWSTTWTDANHVAVTYRMQLNSGVVLYPVISLVRSSTSWYVAEYPALAPMPVPAIQSVSTPTQSTIYFTPSQNQNILGTLQNFFNVYLSGNTQLVSRLTNNSHIQVAPVLPTGSVLTKVSFVPLSASPMVVHADIQVSVQKTVLTLGYKVTLTTVGNELYISDLQFD